MYINQKYIASLEWLMLEIKLPREITKSPLATETALAGLLQGSGISTAYARNFEGKMAIYSSLEVASIEGVIHFYIRIQKKYRNLIEANFYAQYPDVEIVEVDDYTKLIRYHHLSNDVNVWGLNFRTQKKWNPRNPETGLSYGTKDKPLEMRADFYPIKTYVDYGLDKDPKEEYKTDPITGLLELMGSLGKGEYLWYQILVQDEAVYNGTKMPKFYINSQTHKHFSLKEMADERKKQIRTSGYIRHGDTVMDEYGYAKPSPRKVDTGNVDKDGKPILREIDLTYNLLDEKGKPLADAKAVSKKEMELTQEDKDELEIINKKMSKPLALVVVRLMYIAKKENFKGSTIPATLSHGFPYTGINKFGPVKFSDPYEYPWQKQGGKRSAWRGEEMFEEYVEREGFFPHIKSRDSLDAWEDRFFWPSSMKQRKMFRMIYEAIFFPFDHPTAEEVAFTLNLEELATLWHLPGAVAGTPTLPRIDSTKGIAPVNLPL